MKKAYTKNPTIRRMCWMAEKLRERYKEASSVDIDCFAYDEFNGVAPAYRIYVANHLHNLSFRTWRECQKKFYELIEV